MFWFFGCEVHGILGFELGIERSPPVLIGKQSFKSLDHQGSPQISFTFNSSRFVGLLYTFCYIYSYTFSLLFYSSNVHF